MPAFNQLLNSVQVDHLPVTNNTTASVDMTGFRSVAFLVNFSSANGTATVALERSSDGSNWTAVAPSYYTSATVKYPTAGGTSLTANGTITAASSYLAIEFNRLGRETSVPAVTDAPATNKYLRANITSGTVGYALALKSNPTFEPVPQPDFIVAQTKGSN